MRACMQVNPKIEFANTLRGLAAFFVLISHYFSAFWYKREEVSNLINAPLLHTDVHPIPIYVAYINQVTLLDWGSYGVGLFFIISGFVIPFSLQKTNALVFCIRRFFRILPIYFVGFSITLLTLFWATKYFNTQWPYTLKEILIHYIPGVRDVFGSRNIDIIIWTLEIEIKFYLISALAIIWFKRYSLKVFLIPTTFFLLSCYMSYMLPEWIIHNLGAFIWSKTYMMSSQFIIYIFIGVVFHYLFCHKIDLDKGYLGISALFTLFCISWWAGPYSENFFLVWNYAFALLTFMFAYTFPYFFRANILFDFLANISYPLYIIHSIAGYVLLRTLLNTGYKIGTSLFIVVIISLLFSWLLHKWIELPSQILGKKLSDKLMSSNLLLSKFNLFLFRKT
jgi:peptidoglycan/LPS O-acetylase OafA/YrhL